MAIHCDIVLQAVAVKQPLSKDADRAEELLVDHQWLQEFSGLSGVPRLLGVCKDNHARTCIITSPVGKALTWELWDSSSGTSLPLHQCLDSFVNTIKQVHAAGVVLRDLRPANLIYAGAVLMLVDWGSAVSISSQQGFSGTLHYASDRVLQQLGKDKDIADAADVQPADDLVSLVRCMFVIKHPACAAQLRWHNDPTSVTAFWGGVMSSHAAWKAAQDAAQHCDYGKALEALITVAQ